MSKFKISDICIATNNGGNGVGNIGKGGKQNVKIVPKNFTSHCNCSGLLSWDSWDYIIELLDVNNKCLNSYRRVRKSDLVLYKSRICQIY